MLMLVSFLSYLYALTGTQAVGRRENLVWTEALAVRGVLKDRL